MKSRLRARFFRRSMTFAACALALGTAATLGTGAAPPPAPAHRHRLVGVAAKSAMMHASVLHHESAPGRNLDRDLARQNADEIVRLAGSQIANLHALEADPKGNEPAASEVAEMSALGAQARAEADSLLGALSSAGAGGQAAVRDRAQRLFHLERHLLALHQSAEAALGITPPEDPPAPGAAGR